MKVVSALLIAFTVSIWWLACCSGQTMKPCDDFETLPFSESDLQKFLFANYSKYSRPRRSISVPVEVTLGLRVSAIHQLIEREHTLVLDGYLSTIWMDDYLVWNTSFPYLCITNLPVPSDLVWLPDVAVINSPNGMYSLSMASGFAAQLNSDGSVAHCPAGQLYSTCHIEVAYFPFDRQICNILIESWKYMPPQQKFILSEPGSFTIIDNSWTENNEWQIEGNHSKLLTTVYPSGDTYQRVIFTLILGRKPLFYYVNVMAPSMIISVVEVATFVLPLEEPIKLHISFTCLLAYSVFQGMVIGDLPRSGDSVPLLCLYIDLQMAYIGLIAILGESLVFVVIREGLISARKGIAPNQNIYSAFTLIGKLLRVECQANFQLSNSQQPLFAAMTDSNMIANFEGQKFHRSVSLEKQNSETENARLDKDKDSVTSLPAEEIHKHWVFIGEVIERINAVLYIVAITITPIIMFAGLTKTVPDFKLE